MTRDERLDALKQAVDSWADNRRTEIDKKIESSKRLLKERGDLANKANLLATALAVDAIQQFLDGD